MDQGCLTDFTGAGISVDATSSPKWNVLIQRPKTGFVQKTWCIQCQVGEQIIDYDNFMYNLEGDCAQSLLKKPGLSTFVKTYEYMNTNELFVTEIGLLMLFD